MLPGSGDSATRVDLSVRKHEDVLLARQDVVRFAAGWAFRSEDLGRIGVIVTELASNLIKHAGGGRLECRALAGGRPGICIVAHDEGPGIADIEKALQPGFSTAGSYGDGLPTVRELADQFIFESELGRGTRVEVHKWVA